MNVYEDIKTNIISIISKLEINVNDIIDKISVEPPKEELHGDISTNVAMLLSKTLKKPPLEIAKIIKLELEKNNNISKVDIAGPGFINLYFHTSIWQKCCFYILDSKTDYGRIKTDNANKINVEYVSANPTGPMHIGHARGAVFGDSLANLLEFTGYNVTREYYINDAGEQVNNLARSVYKRYLEILNIKTDDFTDDLYPGEYLVPVAEQIVSEYEDKYIDKSEEDWLELFKTISIKAMMEVIKHDLSLINVKHDVFTSEAKIHKDGYIDKVVSILDKKNLLYQGVLDPPKGKLKDDWESRAQLLFKSSLYGDDIDRPLKKSDDSWTYFAADAAYHYEKCNRNYKSIINVWGADHGGYVKRVGGVINAFSERKIDFNVKLCQLVSLSNKGKPFKMSKRAGNFITMKHVIESVGPDVLRFIMLTRKNDATLDFDMNKVLEESKENPVYYVQYAYARVNSLLDKSKSLNLNNYKIDYSLLNNKEEVFLMKLMAKWPRFVEAAAKAHEPHRITIFLNNLAGALHSYWAKGNEDEKQRIIIEDDLLLTRSRLALAETVQKLIGIGLKIIGVQPLDKLN